MFKFLYPRLIYYSDNLFNNKNIKTFNKASKPILELSNIDIFTYDFCHFTLIFYDFIASVALILDQHSNMIKVDNHANNLKLIRSFGLSCP